MRVRDGYCTDKTAIREAILNKVNTLDATDPRDTDVKGWWSPGVIQMHVINDGLQVSILTWVRVMKDLVLDGTLEERLGLIRKAVSACQQ